ncbi:AHH domain-containing protein [Pendulispora albinea]|uniref:AHH domain-containing protein n=1 Tax=Pendulispora albinea TaxID=2741071 RepID=A0ABZ2M9I5_9BACT
MLSWNEKTDVIECRPVNRTFVNTSNELADLDVSTPDGISETVHTTLGHPFWIEGKGWTQTHDLVAGDRARSANGSLIVVRGWRDKEGRSTVYNFEVDENHSYFVGPLKLLVHNTSSISASSKILAAALSKAGFVRGTGEAAHHIVAGGAKAAAPARQVLQNFGIGINEAANGVFLPGNMSSANPAAMAVHAKIHSGDYYRAVNAALSGATSKQEALEILQGIRQALIDGGFP